MSQSYSQNTKDQNKLEKAKIAFYLESDEQAFKIQRVDSVSVSGAKLTVSASLKKGDIVSLKYVAEIYNFSLQGTVTYCQSGDNKSCDIGIEFDRANQDKNTLFFLALRKHLDNFDGEMLAC